MEEQPRLIIHKQTLPFLNLSLYLNDFKPILNLSVENANSQDTGAVELIIKADLPCLEDFNYRLASIPANTSVQIPLTQLKVNREFLNSLSESERTSIIIEVREEGQNIQTDNFDIQIHPIAHFGGFEVLPELIASFVTPNHPYVYHIKRQAILVMERMGLKTAFEGYGNNDRERVIQVVAAIYAAINNENIVYSALPPGYEATGQRIRLLDTIQKEQFANCIDLSLLFAACLEAVELNPIIIITRGHAFVGCWLQDEKFPEVINDDKTAITKRLSKGIREMIAVEATSVCKGAGLSFSAAVDAAEAQLVESERFLLSVDIKRARTLRIRPLPLGLAVDESQPAEQDPKGELSMVGPFDIGEIYQDDLSEGRQPATKQKVWERKLLDLSLRNSLLSLRFTRNMIQLVDIDISHLEDVLSDGRSFSILPAPQAEPLKRYNLFMSPLHQSSSLYQLANDELKQFRLLTYYHQQDLDHILTHIYKHAKLSIEENGFSTLYLGVGLLKWYDRKSPEQPRYAPILLIPVEISRRSVNSRFTLRSREEEAMVNITLIEFLRQEYELDLGALEQLPADEKGVDVAKVMGILRRAIMQLKGWDVVEQLVLGNFSFSKLILWKDIVVHQDDLVKSEMVRSLVEGKLKVNLDREAYEPHDFDRIHAQSLVLPIPTDVSQMEAVLTAQQGISFILHGPPGTGKSQTITNIIADSLYRGKRVLFVAAKKAALDVVHRRLEQIGLGPFTLELHSNKSKKSDVLNQLAQSLETARMRRTADFLQEAQRLDAAKAAISDYVTILHKQQPWGWSLYDAISALEDYKQKGFKKDFIPETVLQQLDADLWTRWVDWIPQYQSIAALVTHPLEQPLNQLHLPHYSSGLAEDLEQKTTALLSALPIVQGQVRALAQKISFSGSVLYPTDWNRLSRLLELMQSMPNVSLDLISYLSDREQLQLFESWAALYEEYLNHLNWILNSYNRNLLDQDIESWEMNWKMAQQSWLLPRWIKTGKIRKQVSLFKKVRVNDSKEVTDLFERYHLLQDVQRQLQRYHGVVAELKGLYREEHTDMGLILRLASWVRELQELASGWDQQLLGRWMLTLKQSGVETGSELFRNHGTVIEELKRSLENFSGRRHELEAYVGFKLPEGKGWYTEALVTLEGVKEQLPNLKDWMNYVQLRAAGEQMQLGWLVAAFERRNCTVHELVDYFYYTAYASTAHRVIALHESLSLFNHALFEQKLAQYRQAAKDFQSLTVQELRVKLAAQLPNPSVEAMQSSELGILKRAIKSRGRGWSLRKLFDQIPTLLPRVAPCMLMSPISVAQYFDVDNRHFDILIFDEASQLPTCEAISAMARARQVVIVGDPKQMPPTSFFASARVDEDNMEVEDLESILDDCLSLSVPSKYLLRHYRSKHESLIAFSNVNFYDSKLLTFPSYDDLNRKVNYHHVPGHYDKGRTRTNKFEADRIVEYIRSHYKHPERKKYSLGVVTFSQVQQGLIEDKLQTLFVADPELEQVANESEEPLFIKNLENVQGDERDIILFSVCYAPDAEGVTSMNFGPLNREGGWRRLNVAVTRARYEMHVFATLRADQIDLSRTTAEGVAGLKAFLQFAERGQLPVRPEDLNELQGRRHLSNVIAQRLRDKGFDVKCHIGTSGYRLDIGIVHPDHPHQYILGVLIDGYNYYKAQTMNDREMVMPSVLRGLGWQLYRVWTMDWMERADTIIDEIVDRVKELQSVPPMEVAAPLVEERVKEDGYVEEENLELTDKRSPYVVATLESVSGADGDTIFDLRNRGVIRNQITKVVSKESPISKSLLYRRILGAWNISRAGARLDRHLSGILDEMRLMTTQHHQVFYWSGPPVMDYYRSNDVERRNMEDIAPEELMVAMMELLVHNFSIEEEELLRYLAKVFGFSKMGRQMEPIIRRAVDLAVIAGLVLREQGRVVIVARSL